MASLSARGRDAASANGTTLLWDVLKNLWHPDDNPTGFVSLAMAENALMHARLLPRLLQDFEPTPHMLTYGDGTTGSNRLKSVLSTFLTRKLRPLLELEAAHITVTNGCCSALEQLAWAIADPGEAFLLGKPYFRAFVTTLGGRMHVDTAAVSFGDVDPFGPGAVGKYEEALLEAREKGQRIKGVILCNPHNPLGRCYPRETIVGLMKLCQKYQIHLVSDEIYALSVWGPGERFHSCLSIDTAGVIDPSLVHIVWGTSKDFGANGLRVGAVVSQHNPDLHAAVGFSSIHSSAASIAQESVANILQDTAWVDAYITDNHLKLSEHFSLVVEWAKSSGVPVAPGSNAAFFVWVDLGTAYRVRHPKVPAEDAFALLSKVLLSQKVLLAAGEQFGAEEPGWFRLVYSLSRQDLNEGLHRISLALEHRTATGGPDGTHWTTCI
ncbi:putative inactive 1-aminocyclopropane-1-carboxylate synthase-like protein 2 [Colletotrichum liriopes]|uniref:Inactive 1-aminocyclopropane-1-carboxylate synthase-like protein 2 n=1 Tax=Colletotrichum liriopes TaxID=708192 RepID=A0AA37GZ11_9PEZI|nr:putative inactive 1-aminocyclopropane-1-carboxylate synthase-like protein 2 [Colletotrichum liriopes]